MHTVNLTFLPRSKGIQCRIGHRDAPGLGMDTDDQADFIKSVGECADDKETVEEVGWSTVGARDGADSTVHGEDYDWRNGAFEGSVEVCGAFNVQHMDLKLQVSDLRQHKNRTEDIEGVCSQWISIPHQ
jgi:hypothetical protein